MADTKISALTTLVAGDIQHTSDVVAIVDTSVTTTKKATAQAVVNAVLAQNTDTTVTGTINQTTIPTSKTLLVSTDIGSTVQGYDAQLADVAGLAVTDGNFIVGNGTNFVAESGSTARTSLGLGTGDSPEFTAVNIGNATDTTVTRVSAGVIAVEGSNVLLASNIGTTVQAYDAQLADVAGLTPTDNGVIIGNGANFVVESGATLKTSLGLTIGTDVQAYDADTAKLDVAQTFTADQTFNNPTVFSAGTASLPSITFTGDTNTGIFSPAADTIAFTEGGVEAARFDSAGNFGLGVTPSASTLPTIQSEHGVLSGNSGINIIQNSFYNTNFKYTGTGLATRYYQGAGKHEWYTAASGTAGNAISFTQAMTLDGSGRLILGDTTADGRLKVVETAAGAGVTFYNSANNSAGQIGTTNESGTVNGLEINAYRGDGKIVFKTAGAERARIDSSGQLMLGTTSTDSALSVNIQNVSASSNNVLVQIKNVISGEDTGLIINGNNGGQRDYRIGLNTIDSTPDLTFSGPTGFRWYVGGAERARIDSSGNLLVGKTSSSSTVGDGFGFSPDGQGHVASGYSSNSATVWSVYSTGAAAYRFYVGYGGTVYATNTTISAISDQRFKENIQDLDVGLDKIMALKPRKFDWKAGKGKDIQNDRGFIAQEIEQVFPDLVDAWADPAPEGEEPYKSVRQDLIPVLVKAIQELKTELDTANTRLAALENK